MKFKFLGMRTIEHFFISTAAMKVKFKLLHDLGGFFRWQRKNWIQVFTKKLNSKRRDLSIFIQFLNILEASCEQSFMLSQNGEVEGFIRNEIIRKLNDHASTSHHNNCKKQGNDYLCPGATEKCGTTNLQWRKSASHDFPWIVQTW